MHFFYIWYMFRYIYENKIKELPNELFKLPNLKIL